MADAKISALTDGGGFAAGDQIPIDRAGANYRAQPIGVPVLVYRYTVTGSDKASIDTGADTADAGSNDWTNGDLLEVWLLARTDDAGAFHDIDMTLNNDGSSIYDSEAVQAVGGSTGTGSNVALAAWPIQVHGSGGSASYPAAVRLVFPGFTATTFWKTAEGTGGPIDATSGNQIARAYSFGYRSTSAITRLKVAGQSTAKLKVGSKLLIYKRLAS